MQIEEDEILQSYLEESLEHLADIENDFLAIEAAGADIDEDLVNKVYRAAHSIKGGAGFMGLDNIKDLTHEMENILGKIRSMDLVPNPEIINILLIASDTVRNMINDVASSNDTDISEQVAALKSITEVAQTQEEGLPEETSDKTDETLQDIRSTFPEAEENITDALEEGKSVYLVEMDLIRDLHDKGRPPSDFIEELKQVGSILDAEPDVDEAGNLDPEEMPDRFPLMLLFTTILRSADINMLFEMDEENIHEVTADFTLRPVGRLAKEQAADVKEKEKPLAEEEKASIEDPGINAGEPASPVEPVKKVTEKVVAQKQPQATPKTRPKKPAAPRAATADTSLRVHVSLLDSLMTLAGELVLSRNQLLQSISSDDAGASEIAGQRIDMITSELQEAIMLTRMQPIGNVFNKFPRVVRDLARNLGKEVELVLEGKDVELDKTIIETISDPLTHLVRNSVDHGIETPDDRQTAGKNPMGEVLLKAYHEAGQVNIEISDDGKGLDGDKLAVSALNKGLLTEEQARTMSDKEKVSLIFLPGFSTAEKVTDVSGRGVGMDVVKTNLDKLGGQTDIESKPGLGTTIHIKLPLTLAIIPSQIIVTGAERYAIPQVNMEELLRIPPGQVKEKIEKVGDADVVRLRGKLLPLIRLADVIGVEQTYLDPEEKALKNDQRVNIADRRSRQSPIETENSQSETEARKLPANNTQHPDRKQDDRRYHAESALNIVVVSAGTFKYGLIVDKLLDSEEIVVKPLGRHLKQCRGYAGATIMGDGRLALILDISNLARMAGLTSVEGTDRAAEVARKADEQIKAGKDMQSLLVFRCAEEEQFAVPLNQVERIQRIKRDQIEEVGGKRVMQYRNNSLPLFAVDQVARVKPRADNEDVLVIVFLISGHEIGLLANPPLDAVDTSLAVDESTLKQPGIMGSTIVGGYTTMLVDTFDLIRTLNPEWFLEGEKIRMKEGEAPTILYAEDSRFFRNQVKAYMEDMGYNVMEAEDGMIAWDLLQEHEREISLVVTDIEMPNLDGLGLARNIKGDDRFSHLPIIAITTLAGDEDVKKGKEVGIDDYQVKLDRENLLASIRRFLE